MTMGTTTRMSVNARRSQCRQSRLKVWQPPARMTNEGLRANPCAPPAVFAFSVPRAVHESRIELQRREGEHAKEKKGRYSVLAVAGGRCTLVQGLVPYSETCIGRLGFGNNLDLHVPRIVVVKEIKTCIV
jgi:hypothetical protein